MALKLALSPLKAKALQHIAFVTGLPSSGTKQNVVNQLAADLERPRLPRNAGRIVSVDMGIRNLAYCVLDTPDPTSLQKQIRVREWQRLDVLGRMVKQSESKDAAVASHAKESSDQPAVTKPDFSPAIMASAALDISRSILSHEPTTILIERQRFRSGGGSAIQEWTVRVNMLESMLWACIGTMRQSQGGAQSQTFPASFEVSPKRVAGFWTAGSEDLLRPALGLLGGEETTLPELPKRLRVESKKNLGKNDKIAVVRSWLADEGGVALTFSPSAQAQADAFVGAPRSKKRASKTTSKVIEDDVKGNSVETQKSNPNKRDDLADCLLQGVAWFRWEQNRLAVLSALKDG